MVPTPLASLPVATLATSSSFSTFSLLCLRAFTPALHSARGSTPDRTDRQTDASTPARTHPTPGELPLILQVSVEIVYFLRDLSAALRSDLSHGRTLPVTWVALLRIHSCTSVCGFLLCLCPPPGDRHARVVSTVSRVTVTLRQEWGNVQGEEAEKKLRRKEKTGRKGGEIERLWSGRKRL